MFKAKGYKPEVLKVAQIYHTALSSKTIDELKENASFIDSNHDLSEFLVSLGDVESVLSTTEINEVYSELQEVKKLMGKNIDYIQITYA